MADSRFFKNHGPFQLNDIAKKVNGHIANCDTPDQILIKDVASLQNAQLGHITCFHNTKYQDVLRNTQASVCIMHPDHVNKAPQTLTLLIHPKPYRVYGIIAQMFYPDEKENFISPQAVIDPTAKIGKNCYIGPLTYISSGVEIGDNCWIDSNVTITHALIGNNVRIKAGARIGQKGFGFHMDKEGHLNVPQLGCVIIEDNVEIGANTTIDRGSEPNTVIGQGTRIDNLVQIAHNVQIGAHCVIVAQAGIAGSSRLGNGVVIAGQAGIAGHLHLDDRVQVAGQSGVMRSAHKGEIIAGSPAVPVREWHKQNIILKRLITKSA